MPSLRFQYLGVLCGPALELSCLAACHNDMGKKMSRINFCSGLSGVRLKVVLVRWVSDKHSERALCLNNHRSSAQWNHDLFN